MERFGDSVVIAAFSIKLRKQLIDLLINRRIKTIKVSLIVLIRNFLKNNNKRTSQLQLFL